ncbi:MAG: 1,4-dihydroxy-2-naphthoate polyprenyltransferase [Flavobacteriales bacterium]
MKIGVWIKAFRLRTLPLSFSTIITGAALALPSAFFDVRVFALCLLTTLFLQILSNLANDYGDFVKGTDNQNRIGPERALQSGGITPGAMKKAMIIFVLLSLISGISLIIVATRERGWETALFFLGLGIASILAAIFYTVGKRAYGYYGWGDVFVFLFFGWVGTAGSFYLLSGSFQWSVLLPASTIGCLSAAVLNLNNLRDHINDAASGKITMVVKLGFEKAKNYHATLIILALLSHIFWSLLFATDYWEYLFLPACFLFLGNILTVFKTNEPAKLDPELKKVALGTFLFSILFFLGQYIKYSA